MTDSEKLSIIKMTKKGTIPKVPFLELKNAILGKTYALSIAFVDSKTSRSLNRKFRKKNKPTNILSFPLTEKSGELVLCEEVMHLEAPQFEKKYSNFVIFLLIHGMLHLKGFDHGSTMEHEEQKFSRKFLR